MKIEEISSLVDGELTVDECRELLDRLGQDHDMRRTWARYHLIGDLLRGGAMLSSAPPEPARVAAMTATVTTLPTRSRMRAPLAGLAIAASIAALAVTLVARAPQDSQRSDVSVAVNPPQPARAAMPVTFVAGPSSPAGPVVEHDARLNGYLVNFNEQRARLGVPGVHPYVRIVGFETK